MNTRRAGHVWFWLVLGCGLAADLISKTWVFRFLSDRAETSHEVWSGVFRLTMHYNSGGPFGFFGGLNTWLIAVTLVALAVIFYLYLSSARKGSLPGVLAASLIAGGAIGNLVDRMSIHHVRDFLDFYVIRYPVFNVADALITVGAVVLFIELFRFGRPAEDTSKTKA